MSTPETDNTPPVQHEPGIYFSMPLAEYMADPALGSSSLAALNVSPIAYWRQSHMNPDREAPGEDEERTFGTLLHCRALEGAEVFGQRYTVKLRPEDYPDAIKGGDALRERCKSLGLKVSGRNEDLEDRIAAVDPSAVLWSRLETAHAKANHGKTLIKAETWAKVESATKYAAADQHAGKALSGGYPEVSLFWEDPETQIRCKARIDYLKPRHAIDLKSFSNKGGTSVERAIASSMARYQYGTQAVHYSEGLEMVKQGLRDGALARKELKIVFGDSTMAQFIDPRPHRFVFVFVESCPFPSIRVREFARYTTDAYGKPTTEETTYWKAARQNVRRALATYDACMKAYGPNRPWMDAAPFSSFTEEELIYSL